MSVEIRPCDDEARLREYIDANWRKGHVLAQDRAMFDFTYRTPWVNRSVFPDGISVLGLYDAGRLVGFLGAIVAPYPRPQSYWLALWHVLPELKGSGMGGKLLERMQSIALEAGGWIGTFGAGPEAVPVYLKRSFCVRAARRWIYNPPAAGRGGLAGRRSLSTFLPALLHTAEQTAPREWIDYRYRRHPVFTYDIRSGGVFRTDDNAWGLVTHACALGEDWFEDVQTVFGSGTADAMQFGAQYLMDAWAFDCPGAGWSLAPEDLPSVFHPPVARGNLIYAVGKPFLMTQVQKGDCDQDRPNEPGGSAHAGEVLAGCAVHQ